MVNIILRESHSLKILNIVLLQSMNTDVKCVASIWKIVMTPHDIAMEDMSSFFFDMMSGAVNMRYFNAQKNCA